MRGPYLTSEQLSDVREHVAQMALAQGGPFRRMDLPTWGVDPELIRSMLRRGWWDRLRYGVYIDRDVLDRAPAGSHARHLIDTAGTILVMDEPVFAFGRSAAAVHDLPLPRNMLDRVSLIRLPGADVRAGHQRSKHAQHLPQARVRTHSLDPADCDVVQGLPTVGRSLAAFSAAAECALDWAVALLDAGAWQRPSAIVDYETFLDDWSVLKGVGTLRRAVPLSRTGAQSPLESLSRVRLTDTGLPEPELQRAFFDEEGLIGYADMTWEALGVIGECDGLGKYDGRPDLISEKVREDRLRALGYIVVRWTWLELMRNPQEIARRILRASMLSPRRAR